MSGLGLESVTPKRKMFRTILAVLPFVETMAEYRLRKKECGGVTGLEF